MSFHLTKNLRLISNMRLWRPANLRLSHNICGSYEDPQCSKETLAKQKPCFTKIRRLEEGKELPKSNSMWENPECCNCPCPGYTDRYDELYYISSDKKKRKYQQTWIDCPQLKTKEIKLCCPDECGFTPMEKRIIKRKPLCACPVGARKKVCMNSVVGKCPRVPLPCVCGGRRPPSCETEHLHSDCVKESAPYPSYSECLRNEREALHPRECNCQDHPKMCEVWAEMRRRMTIKGDDDKRLMK